MNLILSWLAMVAFGFAMVMQVWNLSLSNPNMNPVTFLCIGFFCLAVATVHTHSAKGK